MTAATTGRWPDARPSAQIGALTARALRASVADRRLLFFSLVQPVVLLVVFSQVFHGVAALPEVARYGGYTAFITPAALINVALTTAMSSGSAMLVDLHGGFVERVRVLPVRLGSLLLARDLADSVRALIQVSGVLVAAVLLLGYRPPGGVLGAVAVIALAVLVAATLGWLFLAVACWARTPETVNAVSSAALFPLLFGSSAFMPRSTMPTWLQWVSGLNPLTHAIDAARELAEGRLGAGVGVAVAGCLAVGGVFAWLAVRRFAHGDT